MATHRYRYFIFFGLAVVVLLAGQFSSSTVTVTPEDLDALLIGRLVPGDPISLRISIETAVAGTRFENRWARNEPYDASRLNIFLIDSTYASIAAHRHIDVFCRNAVFLRELHAIVIDSDFVQALGDKYFGADFDMGTRSTLLSWIVGHEIGHLVRGHGTSHFRPNDMMAKEPRRRASEIREDEADAYFADMIRANGESMVYGYVDVFAVIVEHEAELRKASGGQGGPHSAYLVRAFRFLERLVERDENPELAAFVEEWGRELGLEVVRSD